MKEYDNVFKYHKKSDWALAEYEMYFIDFYDDYKNGIYRKNNPLLPEIIGGYGELLFYNKLCEDDSLEVTWAAHEHGDFFGFDIVAYNHVTEVFYFYEVKTTVSRKNFDNFTLSENEYRVFKEIGFKGLTDDSIEMHIVNLLVDNKGIVDMIDYSICDNIDAFLEYDTMLTRTHGEEKRYTEDTLVKKLKKPIN